jgi:hypothetical protein
MTNALRRIDDPSFAVVVKVDGQQTVRNRIVVSRDGKILTQTTTGTNAQGQSVNNVVIWEKQ